MPACAAWELGADEFLTKPFDIFEVRARCRSLLRVKRLVDDLDSAATVVFAFAPRWRPSASSRGAIGRVARYALGLAAHRLSAAKKPWCKKGRSSTTSARSTYPMPF